MTEQSEVCIHAVRAIWAAHLEVKSCANIGALASTDSDLRLRALTVGSSAIRLALSAFAVLEHPNSSKGTEALYSALFAAYDTSEALLGPSQWTQFSAVLSENVYNAFDPAFINTNGIVPGSASDAIEAWAWRNLRLFFREARAKFEHALSTGLTESERQLMCTRLVRVGVKAELAFLAMRTKDSAFIRDQSTKS